MQKINRKISRTLMSLATVWTFLWIGSVCNRLVIYSTSFLYRPVKFKVTTAVYTDDHNLANYWLIGTIEGNEERMIPVANSKVSIRSSKDLLQLFPEGKELDALFNPLLSKAIVQGESLRVIHGTGQYWEVEKAARKRILSIWLLPTIVMILLSRLLKYLNQIIYEKPI